MNFKLGEFFCGPGGIALGAKLAGVVQGIDGGEFLITPSWATDIDTDTCATHARNIHDEASALGTSVFQADVRELDISKLAPCDGFAFGFPCNDFSIVGETKGLDGSFGPLYSYGVEYLKHHQPMWFVAENVGGLSSANGGRAFELIQRKLCEAGYKLYPHLYKFDEYGVPQARKRIIIVGIRDDLKIEFEIPKPNFEYQTAGQALMIPPISTNAANHDFTKQGRSVVERLKYIKAGENAWNADIPAEHQLNVKGARLSNIYRRLDPDKPAYTVTGSGGGGTHMYHWDEPRALTNRERARLQTFPDDFVFSGSKESVRKQIGMAVPPRGIAVIFQSLLHAFAEAKHPMLVK